MPINPGVHYFFGAKLSQYALGVKILVYSNSVMVKSSVFPVTK